METWKLIGLIMTAIIAGLLAIFLGSPPQNLPPILNTGAGSCQLLNTTNQIYNMTDNISISGATCMNITAANVTLNCANYVIVGDNTPAVYGIFSNALNTTVRNCNISNFSTAINFTGARSGNVANNSIYLTSNLSIGIAVFTSNSTNFTNNTISAPNMNATGFLLNNQTYFNRFRLNNITAQTWFSETGGYVVCYQESANVSTGCGGLSTGKYAATVESTDCTPSGGTGCGYIYMNYTKPAGALGAIWQNQFADVAVNNITLSAGCFAQTPLQLRFRSSVASSGTVTVGSYGQCFDGAWQTITSTKNNDASTGSSTASDTARAYDANYATFVYYVTGSGWFRGASGLSVEGYIYEEAIFWNAPELRNNTYNDSTTGNIYYFQNGTPSWNVFSIFDTNGDNYADTSTANQLPFNSTSVGNNWSGDGNDWHPYTGKNFTPIITSIFISPPAPINGSALSCNLTVQGYNSSYNASVEWYKNGVNQTSLAINFTGLLNDTPTVVATLGAGNITTEQNWSCASRILNGSLFSSRNFSANVTVSSVSLCPAVNAVFFAAAHAFQSNVPATNQTSGGLYCVANTAASAVNISMYVTPVISGLQIYCANNSAGGNQITLNATGQNVTSIGANQNGAVWCWANFNNPSRGISFNITAGVG
jgi:hypothetical protein